MTNIDKKDLNGKANPLRMPYEALVAYSKVSDNGLGKYGDRDSWKHSTNGVEVYSNAAARHLFQAMNEPIDKESGLPHLSHALWSVIAAIWHFENNKIQADRQLSEQLMSQNLSVQNNKCPLPYGV